MASVSVSVSLLLRCFHLSRRTFHLLEFVFSELLQKSLRVLTSSNLLLEQLRQLQRTEALQRSGGVLQAEVL